MRVNPLGDGDLRSGKVEEKKKSRKKGKRYTHGSEEVGFFDVLGEVEAESIERRLAELVDEIVDAGNELSRSPTRRNLERYKRKIKEFLQLIEKRLYKLSGKMDYESMKPKLHVIAEEVNEKLNELAQALLTAERPTINIAARVGEINGLIINLLR